MRKWSRVFRLLTLLALAATALAVSGPALLRAAALSSTTASVPATCGVAPKPGGFDGASIALRVAQSFPDRRSASEGARAFLAFAAGRLRSEGWSVEIQPYRVLVKSRFPAEKSIMYSVVPGDNLLALGGPSAKQLDCLVVAAYDNVFADDAKDLLGLSPTATSASIALEVAARLKREPGISSGVALVSGHYQQGAGIRNLVKSLAAKGIGVQSAVVIGDVVNTPSVPLVAAPNVSAALVDSVTKEAERSGLVARVTSAWMLELLTRQAKKAAASPESSLGLKASGEHDVLADARFPVLTVGYPEESPAFRQNASAGSLEDRARGIAEALSSALTARIKPGGLLAQDTQVVQALGKTYLVPAEKWFRAGTGLAAALTVIALYLTWQKQSSLALAAGTTAAAAVSLMLHSAFSGRPSTSYASDLYPGRAMALFFIIFALLTATTFLRLWSTRSRMRHLHERLPSGAAEPTVKGERGSPWSLGILSALSFGAAIARSEILPSLLIATVSQCAGTLMLTRRPDGRSPSPLALWVARGLYMIPFAAVFWAGNPLSPARQAVYRSAWTGLNRGSLVSAVALSAVVASLLSTFEFPKPVKPKVLLPLALCEAAAVALLIVAGLFLPAKYESRVGARALFHESYGSEVRLSVDSLAPITEVTLRGATKGIPERLVRTAARIDERVSNRQDVPWAKLGLSALPSKPDEKGRTVAVNASFASQPDILMLELSEIGARMSQAGGFSVSDPGSIMSAESAGAANGGDLLIPPGYSATLMWWKPDGQPSSSNLTVIPKGIARLDCKLLAIYLGRSYLGITPETEGVVYRSVTSVTAGAFQ